MRGTVSEKAWETPQVIKREISLEVYKRKVDKVVGNKCMAETYVHQKIKFGVGKV